MHAHTYTLHTQHMAACAWLGDHQGGPSAPTNSLHKLHMARYQVLLTYLLTYLQVESLHFSKISIGYMIPGMTVLLRLLDQRTLRYR